MAGISVSLIPEEWDGDAARSCIMGRPDRRRLNEDVETRMRDSEIHLHSVMAKKNIKGMNARRLLDYVLSNEDKDSQETGVFPRRFTAFADDNDKLCTSSVYMQTIRRMKASRKHACS